MRSTVRACLVLLVLVFSSSAARADDVVLQWNKIAVDTLTTQTPGLTPFHQARFAAIIQLAVFEAVNAITGEYESYLGSPGPEGLEKRLQAWFDATEQYARQLREIDRNTYLAMKRKEVQRQQTTETASSSS